jgi:hypothetical protein
MATIVQHKQTGLRFVLIGSGFGARKAIMPSLFGGSLFPREEGQKIPVAAVSDALGNIMWLFTKDLQVVEVDGVRIADYFKKGQAAFTLKPGAGAQNEEEICPACQFRVSTVTKECPSCGLTLMSEDHT